METKHYLLSTLYALLFFSLGYMAYTQPTYNWDLLPYVGATLSIDRSDKEYVHRRSYAEAERVLPRQAFGMLTHPRHPFRTQVHKSAEYFSQQLPIVRVKPLYIAMIYTLQASGVNIVKATFLVSVISGVFSALLVLLWLQKYFSNAWGYLMAALLVVSAGMITVARLSTPDALSAALLLLGVFLLLEKKWLVWSGVVFILSIYARLDNIIIVSFIFTYLFLLAPREYRFNLARYMAFIIALIASYWLISYYAESYSWDVLFTHAIERLLVNPKDAYVSLTREGYMAGLIAKSEWALLNPVVSLSIFVMLASAAFSATGIKLRIRNVYADMMLVTLMAIAVRYALFPLLNVRYYYGHCLVIGVCALILLHMHFRENRETGA